MNTWKVHTPNLLKEIIEGNPHSWALRQPVLIFRSILVEVAQRALELEDDELLGLMQRLTLVEPVS